jgi:hypothetical protein
MARAAEMWGGSGGGGGSDAQLHGVKERKSEREETRPGRPYRI